MLKVKVFAALLLVISGFETLAQLTISKDDFYARLEHSPNMPEKLLSTRSIVVYPSTMTDVELDKIQKSFQETGIDAIAYYDIDLVLAGTDVRRALGFYLNKRTVNNIVFFRKAGNEYSTLITLYNEKTTFVEKGQSAWYAQDPDLEELLKKIYRTASNSLTRQNFLINDHPEKELFINPIAGRRSEFFAIDLKVDQLAVPKFDNEQVDAKLAELFAEYPFKYQLTEAGLSERELRSKGFLYTLCFVHTRGSIARALLGYDVSKPVTAFASVTFAEGQPRFTNIPAEEMVYKFYFKHIESGNVFLGTRWDAHTEWDEALRNHLTAFKTELKVN